MSKKPIKYCNIMHPVKARHKAEINKTYWVPVLSSMGKPLMPCHPARARELVRKGAAIKARLKGIFCIKLLNREDGDLQVVAIGVDPGSRMNGYSVKSPDHTYINIQQSAKNGKTVKQAIATRAAMRRSRRSRNTPCRPPRFNNRSKAGWIPPSTFSRWQHIYNTIAMICRLYPIQHVIVENIKAATKKGQGKWNSCFSPIMAGKNWLYNRIKLSGLELHIAEGYETAELRQVAGLTKDRRKLEFNFFTHALDAWVLANAITGGHLYPDMIQLSKLFRPEHCRRQLHMMSPARRGIRRKYGGTVLPGSICKGTMIKYSYPKAKGTSHLALVIGNNKIGYSLAPITGVGRYIKYSQLNHMQLLYRSNWLWQFPWSYKGYSSRKAYERDISNAPTVVTNCYQ